LTPDLCCIAVKINYHYSKNKIYDSNISMGLIMMFRFKIKQSSLLFLALLLLSFNAFSAEWSLQIDCYDDDAQNEGTPNVVYTTFWAGNRQITNADGTVPGKAPDCGVASDATYKVRDITGTDKITHIIVQTTGDNGFFMDELMAFKGGTQIKAFGHDGGAGWCLSTQRSDSGKFGQPDSGCFKAIRFDIASGVASSTTPKTNLRAAPPSGALSYPNAVIANHTKHSVEGTVNYLDPAWIGPGIFCQRDNFKIGPAEIGKDKVIPKTWGASSRGACLISSIKARINGGPKVISYDSSGTSFSGFLVKDTASGPRIFSEQEWRKKTDQRIGKSPGFAVHNKTDWPLAVSLDQIGCLYHDVVDPGTAFIRDTGAVWFTLSASIAPDGRDPNTDMDCIKPVAAAVGAALVAAATGGAGAFAAAGGSAAGGTAVAALAPIATSAGTFAVGGAVGGFVTGFVGSAAFKEALGRLFNDNGSAELEGQYAGYPWPARCDKMPEYEVTGGPSLEFNDGKSSIGGGTPFTIKKINGCGDDMMLASPKSVSATLSMKWDDVIAAQIDAAHADGNIGVPPAMNGENQPKSPEEIAAAGDVKGPTVKQVFFKDGARFGNVQNGLWQEYRVTGEKSFTFNEEHRDEWSVYLVDHSRGVRIQLDLWTKDITYHDTKGKHFVMAKIDSASNKAP
jgi:hypothetical protein